MAEPMTLQIITPDAIVFEGQSTFFVYPCASSH